MSSSYSVIDIEGIGPAYAERLRQAGIHTVDQLLDAADSPAGRRQLSETTGIAPAQILRWANHADLFRISGIGPQFAEILEAAGVDSVKELSHRRAGHLLQKMTEVNILHPLVRRLPTEEQLAAMIAEAATLAPRLTY